MSEHAKLQEQWTGKLKNRCAPSASRMNNLSAIHGNSKGTATGLRNTGNTCYLNSVVQVIANSSLLVKNLLKGETIVSPPRKLVDELRFLLLVLRSGKFKHVTPNDFKKKIDQSLPKFSGNNQHDAQEFLSDLLRVIETETVPDTPLDVLEGRFESKVT